MLFWWADMQYDLYSTHGKVILYSNGSPEGSCSLIIYHRVPGVKRKVVFEKKLYPKKNKSDMNPQGSKMNQIHI